MTRLFETYRAVHEQAFIPIFVRDDRDSGLLIEACVEAGCRVIEYTLRRQDAHTMIPWIRRRFPELHVLAGSTLDHDGIVHQARRRHPQLRTLAELVDMGVDGFVSMVGWNPDKIRKYSPTHLVIPGAMTVNEAYRQFGAGAHFIKVLGPSLELVRLCRHPATFEHCPVLITGGMAPDRIPEAVAAGVMVVGSGFDLMLQNVASPGQAADIARVVRRYLDVTRTARGKAWPSLAGADGQDRRAWLDALPHNHPFEHVDRAGETGCAHAS